MFCLPVFKDTSIGYEMFLSIVFNHPAHFAGYIKANEGLALYLMFLIDGSIGSKILMLRELHGKSHFTRSKNTIQGIMPFFASSCFCSGYDFSSGEAPRYLESTARSICSTNGRAAEETTATPDKPL
jgi:hypothetical protein